MFGALQELLVYFHYKRLIIVEPRLPVAYHLHLVITDSFICPCRESPYFFF